MKRPLARTFLATARVAAATTCLLSCAPALAAQTIDCRWTVTSPSLANFTDGRAGYMASPAGLQLTFTTRNSSQNGSGMYVVTGFTGSGVYQPSGTTGDMALGVFNLPTQGGAVLMLAPGNDKDVEYNGQVVDHEPLPPTVTITNYTTSIVQGIISGELMDMAGLTATPPRVVRHRVQIQFNAISLTSPGDCP